MLKNVNSIEAHCKQFVSDCPQAGDVLDKTVSVLDAPKVCCKPSMASREECLENALMCLIVW